MLPAHRSASVLRFPCPRTPTPHGHSRIALAPSAYLRLQHVASLPRCDARREQDLRGLSGASGASGALWGLWSVAAKAPATSSPALPKRETCNACCVGGPNLCDEALPGGGAGALVATHRVQSAPSAAAARTGNVWELLAAARRPSVCPGSGTRANHKRGSTAASEARTFRDALSRTAEALVG